MFDTGDNQENVFPLSADDMAPASSSNTHSLVERLSERLQVYAISATCPHAGGPVDEGTLTGDMVECPWHGSRFCLRNRRVLTGSATVNAPRYHVRVRNGQIELKRAGDH